MSTSIIKIINKKELAKCTAYARLLYLGLLEIARKDGSIHEPIHVIHAKIFPQEPDIDIKNFLVELHEAGFIERRGNLMQLKNFNRPSRTEYPVWFNEIWDARPNRDGDNPKRRAYQNACARLREGYTKQQMLDGTIRYANWIKDKGLENQCTVKQLATLLGPNLGFLESWASQSDQPAFEKAPTLDKFW